MGRDGRGPTDLVAASAQAALGRREAAFLSCAGSFRVSQPGPVPAAYLATRQDLGLEFGRSFPFDPSGGLWLRGRAERSLSWDTEGEPSSAASMEAGLDLRMEAWSTRMTISIADDGGWDAGVEGSLECLLGSQGVQLSGSAAVRFPEGAIRAEAEVAFRSRSYRLSAGAWLESCPLTADVSQAWKHAGFSLGWQAWEVLAACP